MPSFDDTYFVTKSSETSNYPQGRRHNNDPHYHSGFRVAGVYSFCECDREFYLDYTHLGVSQRKTVNGDFLWASLGRPDFTSSFENYTGDAKSHLKFNYNRADALLEQLIFCGCDYNLRLLFGLEYANFYLRESYRYDSQTTFGTIRQKNYTWGIGPEVGFSFDYRICQFLDCFPGAFSINVVSSGSILSGKTNNRENNVLQGNQILNVKDRGSWRLIPAFHARVGLNYTVCICDNEAAFEVGYEFDTYSRGLARVTYPDDVADGLAETNYYNFDLQGLYVSATYCF